jgi:sarcosine oxidase/L-pipecolate oxidase
MRTEYDEPLYTRLALEALEAWRDPEWQGIFHETVRLSFPSCDSSRLTKPGPHHYYRRGQEGRSISSEVLREPQKRRQGYET